MKQNNFKVIFETRAGSHLYGTNNELSDIDYRGVCVTSLKEMLNPFEGFDQQVETKLMDRTIYHLKKFTALSAESNPNILELFFADDKNIITMTEDGEFLLDNRCAFLSEKIRKTFMGYAYAQLKRIELHRGYLLNPPKKQPERKDFGLPESPKFGMEKINNIIHAPIEVIEESSREYVLNEQKYHSASENWKKYQQWFQNRNPKRFEYEKKFGYDLKHANHLFRLLIEGEELLTRGNLIFPLKQADFLKDILSGYFKYEEVMEMSKRQMEHFDTCQSILPKKPDYDKIMEVYYEIIFNQ